MKDTSPIPNPDRQTFNGIWTDWSDEHDQKIVSKKKMYRLRSNGPVPEGGKPFFVQIAHPFDGSEPQVTLDPEIAKTFHGDYLLSTCWNWELKYQAVPV